MQRRRRVSDRGDAAVLARGSDCGLAVPVLSVPAAVRDQGVGVGQRATCVSQQTREVGR